MTATLIEVQDVSKKFCRDLKRSLWYGVQDLRAELFGRSRDVLLRSGEFWAAKNISFQIEHGETVGLIGHNGAGKTTLLRMLNGIVRPDSGQIVVRGRMQALIALGAGFNPVLTGRENIYVNASILGLSKAEIKRRFDEIVEFSGIEEFIDTPVQSYSSGMAVRLGFSIAAHLEPDILLVDEVLAVGDLAFKTKCQLRMQELQQRGVAIILVSHNLHTVSHMCSRTITLERGKVIYDGDTEQAINAYLDSLLRHSSGFADTIRAGTGEVRVTDVEILDSSGVEQQVFDVGDCVKIRIHYAASRPVDSPVFNLAIYRLGGEQITGIRTDVDGVDVGTLHGTGYFDITIPNFNLLPNVYSMDAVIFHKDGYTFYDRVNKVAQLKVRGGAHINGTVYLPHSWCQGGGTKSVLPAIASAQPTL